MHHLDLATISTTVVAVIALLAAIGGGINWLYKRGRDEESLASSVKSLAETTGRQADAMEKLAGQVGGLSDKLEGHSETLVEHHWRLKAVEERTVKVEVH